MTAAKTNSPADSTRNGEVFLVRLRRDRSPAPVEPSEEDMLLPSCEAQADPGLSIARLGGVRSHIRMRLDGNLICLPASGTRSKATPCTSHQPFARTVSRSSTR